MNAGPKQRQRGMSLGDREWNIGLVTLIALGCLLVIAISTYRLAQIAVDDHRMDCTWLSLICE